MPFTLLLLLSVWAQAAATLQIVSWHLSEERMWAWVVSLSAETGGGIIGWGSKRGEIFGGWREGNVQAGAGTDAPLISDVGRGHTAHTPKKKRLNIYGHVLYTLYTQEGDKGLSLSWLLLGLHWAGKEAVHFGHLGLVQKTEDLRWNKLIRKCMFFNAVDDIGRPSFSLALWRKVTKVGTFSVSEVAISYIPISIFEKRADMMALKNPNDNRHSRTPPIYIFWAKCWQHMFWYTNEVIYVLSVGRKSWEHMFQFLH